ncbi:unnamed protein product [Closterium sp. NIES-54]
MGGTPVSHQNHQSHHGLLRLLRLLLLLRLLHLLRLLFLLLLRLWVLCLRNSLAISPCSRYCSHRRSTNTSPNRSLTRRKMKETSGADGAEGGTEASAGGGAQGGTADDVFPEGVTGDADDDGVEYWSRDGLPEKLPIPTYPPNNRKRPHPSSQNRDARPPSPMHKLTDHKRQGYTAAEKLKWVALMDLAVSVRALARESGIHRKCLTNWKRVAGFLKDVHSSRKRMHGHGRASWYQPMESGRGRNLKKPSPEVVLRWVSQAWKAVPVDLIKHAFLTCGISNQLDGSEDGLAMAHRRSQLTAEVDVDDDIIADGFFGNNCQEPESDEEE